jgi:spermidine/putrescine transport system ATP-binding protein
LPEGFAPSGQVSIVIRPEHAQIATRTEGVPLSGTLENVVYLGTDTHFHVKLDTGEPFIVRRQNARGHADRHAKGDRVGLLIPADAAQILKD